MSIAENKWSCTPHKDLSSSLQTISINVIISVSKRVTFDNDLEIKKSQKVHHIEIFLPKKYQSCNHTTTKITQHPEPLSDSYKLNIETKDIESYPRMPHLIENYKWFKAIVASLLSKCSQNITSQKHEISRLTYKRMQSLRNCC